MVPRRVRGPSNPKPLLRERAQLLRHSKRVQQRRVGGDSRQSDQAVQLAPRKHRHRDQAVGARGPRARGAAGVVAGGEG